MSKRITAEETALRGAVLAASIKAELRQMRGDRNLEGDRVIWKFKRHLRLGLVNSFGELHDCMDPNVLGDSEQLWEQMHEIFVDEEDEGACESVCHVLNKAQDEVNEWIIAGGLRI